MYEYLDKRYALAIYDLGVEKNKVNEYLSEIRQICSIIDSNSDLKEIVNHPHMSISKRKEIFLELFNGRVEEDVLSFLIILVEKDRIVNIRNILKELERIDLDRNNILIVEVKTVIRLEEKEKEELVNKLTKKYRKTIVLKEEIDKEIIGGVFLRIGDDVIDGSIKNKIYQIKKLMLKHNNDGLIE